MNIVQDIFERCSEGGWMTNSRDELRRRLVDAAEARIAREGLSGLRARDVTKDAGCALGGLYTVFEDLDMLILAVSSRTLGRLQTALDQAAAAVEAPQAQLQALALAYLRFAVDNQALWFALFRHDLGGHPVPDWHHAEHARLLALIVRPLSRLQTGLDDAGLALRARTLFSAVHGVVSLSLEGRFAAAQAGDLAPELSAFVRQAVAGMQAESPA
jgi:AcrR family transcriptional regulator